MATWDELRALLRAHLEALRRRRLGKPKSLNLKTARKLPQGYPLLFPPLKLILSHPEERLIVYGTLVPGGKFHHLLADLKATWEPCRIRGRLGTYSGYPSFKWNPHGEAHPAWLVTSPELPARFALLDRFEGRNYTRRLIPVQIGSRLIVAHIYEGKIKA